MLAHVQDLKVFNVTKYRAVVENEAQARSRQPPNFAESLSRLTAACECARVPGRPLVAGEGELVQLPTDGGLEAGSHPVDPAALAVLGGGMRRDGALYGALLLLGVVYGERGGPRGVRRAQRAGRT